MTMLKDSTESLSRIRKIVFDNIEPGQIFTFDSMTARDYSNTLQDISLFDQNEDFFAFEGALDDVRRAGPSKASPTRNWGALTITVFTKDVEDDLGHMRRLEVLSAWFAEKTVRDIRFRSFIPLAAQRVMGFISFSGALSFDFEVQPKG